jgi:DNA-binding SARP family transcriptional activator/predicted negative regulator of RcsB-dependent stress response
MSRLELGLLGGFRMRWSGKPDGRLGSLRAEVLLAYLALRRGTPEPRRQLAYLFWPDSSEAQARTNLRRELHTLRKILPETERLLEVDSRSISMRLDAPITLDVAEFEQGVERANGLRRPDDRLRELEKAVACYHGDLLPDCYDEWAEEERGRLRQCYASALEQLVEVLEGQLRHREALVYAKRLVQHDPLLETSCRTLMRLHALNGDRAAAVRAFESCAAALTEELGAKPSRELRADYLRLRTGGDEELMPAPSPAPDPLLGREWEWQALYAAWKAAASGKASAAAVLGEAGIGKTRLAEQLFSWAEDQGYSTARARCYQAEGSLAFAPVVEWFRSPAIARGASRLEPVWSSDLARVLPELADGPGWQATEQPLSESWQRRRLFEALSRAIAGAQQPLLLLLDDAQWCDHETLEWLHHLLRFNGEAKLLVLLTVRSEELDENRALAVLLLELRRQGRLSEVAVGPLDLAAATALGNSIASAPLSAEEAQRLFARSEGHPLYLVELARAGLSGAAWSEPDEEGEMESLPPRIQAVLAARMTQLSSAARSLAQLAAVIGRAFSTEVLAASSDLDEPALVEALDELWRKRIVREQANGLYDFCHDLIREVAYVGAGPAPRSFLHRRVAQALEKLHAGDMDRVSVQIASHYERSGQIARAVHFYRVGAGLARSFAASSEAIRLLRQALSLLQRLPASEERERLELELQYALSAPLNASLGYASPELEASLERVRTIGSRLGQDAPVISSLVGLFGVHFVKGNSRRSREMGEEAVRISQRHPQLLPASHFALGGALFSLGRFQDAMQNFRRSEIRQGEQPSDSLVIGTDLSVFRDSYYSHAAWHLGRSTEAESKRQNAISRAERLEDPYNLAVAYAYGAILAQFVRDVASARECAEAVSELSSRFGYAYYGEWGRIIRGWVLTEEGRPDEGLATIDEGLKALDAVRAEARRPYYLSLRARALQALAQTDRAAATLDEALALASRFGDQWWDAELLRMRGELELTLGDHDEAERFYREARHRAEEQGAKSLELRATLSLAQMLAPQERFEEALTILRPITTELAGGGSRDQLAARTLLERLQ